MKAAQEMDKRKKTDSMYESSYRRNTARRSPEMERDQEEKDRSGPWRGFLILKCAECGKVRAFNTKHDIYVYRCGCGAETLLENLKPMYLNCKCGAKWRYRTNLEDEYADHKCIRCGSVVRMRLNKRKTAYVTER